MADLSFLQTKEAATSESKSTDSSRLLDGLRIELDEVIRQLTDRTLTTDPIVHFFKTFENIPSTKNSNIRQVSKGRQQNVSVYSDITIVSNVRVDSKSTLLLSAL